MQRVTLKGGKPGREDAIEIAIRKVGDDLDRYDLDSMAAKNAPPDEDLPPTHGLKGTTEEDSGSEACEDCAAGTCENPDHLSEEDLRALEMMGKEE